MLLVKNSNFATLTSAIMLGQFFEGDKQRHVLWCLSNFKYPCYRLVYAYASKLFLLCSNVRQPHSLITIDAALWDEQPKLCQWLRVCSYHAMSCSQRPGLIMRMLLLRPLRHLCWTNFKKDANHSCKHTFTKFFWSSPHWWTVLHAWPIYIKLCPWSCVRMYQYWANYKVN